MKQKITLSMNETELAQFKNLVENSDLQGLKDLADLILKKENSLEYSRRRIFEALSNWSGFDIDYIKETHRLKTDLGLMNYHKKSLRVPFQQVVEDLGSDKIILISECVALKLVSQCLELVNSKL